MDPMDPPDLVKLQADPYIPVVIHLCNQMLELSTSVPVVFICSVCAGGSEEGGNVTSEAWFDAEEDFGDGGRNLTEELLRKAMESKTDGKGKFVF